MRLLSFASLSRTFSAEAAVACLGALALFACAAAFADVPDHSQAPMGPASCSAMELWAFESGMCEPLAMAAMPMAMTMVHVNGFFVGDVEEGPRAQNRFSIPNMVMLDTGRSLGDTHYLDLDLMMTLEKWTFAKQGYPELMQIGERNENGAPFIDSQHPHSSPIMGLTFSDRIRLGDGKDSIKLFFAPRGQATEGPIAFMHRPTGQVNPDAPLGHHIGQDVGHIASTVTGAALLVGRLQIEVSSFNGREPEPTKVDLPLGALNSYATRISYSFSESLVAMASAAFVKSPEADDPDLDSLSRYSFSFYDQRQLSERWMFHNAFLYGQVNGLEHVPVLSSIAEEFLLHSDVPSYWGRIEYLQRTPAQLGLASAVDPTRPRWISAFTLGYTHRLTTLDGFALSVGASLTKDFLPGELRDAYGADPLSGRVFLQLGGMKMWGMN